MYGVSTPRIQLLTGFRLCSTPLPGLSVGPDSAFGLDYDRRGQQAAASTCLRSIHSIHCPPLDLLRAAFLHAFVQRAALGSVNRVIRPHSASNDTRHDYHALTSDAAGETAMATEALR